MKKFFDIIFLCLFATLIIACDNSKKTSFTSKKVSSSIKKVNSEIPIYEKSDDKVFFISAFGDPVSISYQAYKDVYDCGINYMFIDPYYNKTNINNESNLEKVFEIMDQFDGLKGLIMPNNNVTTLEGEFVSTADYQSDYTKYKSFDGFYFFDEPTEDFFDFVANEYDIFKENYSDDYYFFITIAHHSDNFLEEYQNKVLSKFKNTKSNIISFDNYPLKYYANDETNKIETTYIETLEIMAKVCKENGSSFYNFLQTSGWAYGKARLPKDETEIRWQVGTSLAFGAKGVQCFMYNPLTTSNGFAEYAMLYPSGKKSEIYYFCKEVFSELRSWEEVYLSFEYLGTMGIDTDTFSYNPDEVSKLKYTIKNHERIKQIETKRDTLIGVFVDENNNDGFLFNTYNDPYYKKYNNIKVQFNNCSKVLYYINGEKNVVDVIDGIFEYEMEASDILFVIPLE